MVHAALSACVLSAVFAGADVPVRLGRSDAGVGMEARIAVDLKDAGTKLAGIRFTVLLPLAFEFDASRPDAAVAIAGYHPEANIAVGTAAPIPDGSGNLRRPLRVDVGWASIDPSVDSTIWIRGAIAGDFSLAGTYPLAFDGPVEYRTEAGWRPALADDSEGRLVVHGGFVAVDRVRVRGGGDPVTVRVTATFDKPAGFEKPEDFRVVACAVHVKFDPSLLDLLPVSDADQVGTVMGTKGTFYYPIGDSFDRARRTGDLVVAWIGLLGDPGAIAPGIAMPILFLEFAPKSAGPFSAPIHLALASEGAADPTMLTPETVPAAPWLDAYFDGSVDVIPTVRFVRGDSNSDGEVDIADGIWTLLALFHGGYPPPCLDAADMNDDGTLDVTDAIGTFQHLLQPGVFPWVPLFPPPAAPFPGCGEDPTEPHLGCEWPTAGCR